MSDKTKIRLAVFMVAFVAGMMAALVVLSVATPAEFKEHPRGLVDRLAQAGDIVMVLALSLGGGMMVGKLLSDVHRGKL